MIEQSENLLEVEGLRTYFYSSRGIIRAADDVSFKVRKGEILGIAGESGAGKTVIALSILRLIPYPGRVVSGKILYKGENLLEKPLAEMVKVRGAEIGMIFQDPMSSLNPVFTIGDQITSGIRVHRKFSREKARAEAVAMLKRVHIPDPERRIDAYPHEFSGGMKQRVMIALALSCHPNLLIADNPTTALDSTIQLQFLNLIQDLRGEFGMTILYITHDFGIAARLCDRIAVLYAGEVIEIGSVFTVLKDPRHPYTKRLIESSPVPGMHGKKIEAIEGKQPDLAFLPPGCRFAPRCKFVRSGCVEGEPELVETGTGKESHGVRCILYKGNRVVF
ncbi:MAG: ABC transporter ATP-binding protein [Desulfobacteraceae bacterium]|nr:MAG: ABC transporter ATP-binding protein [Desulfobacteraceae bacterium]